MKRSTINSIKLGPLYWTPEELELEKLSLDKLEPKDDLELDELELDELELDGLELDGLELDELELDGLISLCPAVADELLGADPTWIRVPLLPLFSLSGAMAGRLRSKNVMTSKAEYVIFPGDLIGALILKA